jgi:S-adenosylmethionine hydrolase
MSLITLTTDFGHGSPYVAAMKGVILSLNPAATVVDITHSVPPQDIRFAAVVLEDVTDRFPPGTLHVAVVDPGVGTERGIVFAPIGRQSYIAPDNGLLSRLARRTPPAKIIRLTEPAYWLQPVSATFHGRDIMAPVAARLSLGLEPEHLGEPQERLVMLDWPEVRILPGRIEGSVLMIDSFGNLVTDISAEMLAGRPADRVRISCAGRTIEGILATYGTRPAGSLIGLIGSSGRLELAVVGGSAAEMLGVQAGEQVEVILPDEVHWQAGQRERDPHGNRKQNEKRTMRNEK